MPFEYGYTCQYVDRGIDGIKEDLECHLDTIVNELNDMFYDVNNGKNRDEYIATWVKSIYSDMESNFEGVRESNCDMREAADEQVSNLEDEIEDLKSELEERNKEIEDLESKIDEME